MERLSWVLMVLCCAVLYLAVSLIVLFFKILCAAARVMMWCLLFAIAMLAPFFSKRTLSD